jgi:glyoxylase I family protein
MELEVDHINLVVNDLEGCIGFYRDLLGMRVTMRARLKGEWIERVVGIGGVEADCVYLQPAQGPRLELLRYISPAGLAPAGLDLPNTRGLRHIAFRVEDLDAIYDSLITAGVKFAGPPVEVPLETVTRISGRKRLCYFHDPEGVLLEFCEYLPS